ncbi:MAG: DUF5660 family protein [Patescibacteria group bacterium]
MAKSKTSQHTAAHESEDHLRASIASAKDQVSGFGSDFFSQLLGLDSGGYSEKAGIPELITDDEPGVIFSAKKHNGGIAEKIAKSQEKFTQTAETGRKSEQKAAYDYTSEILNTRKGATQENREIAYKVKQILDELKKLIATSRVLQMQFAEIGVEDAPVNVGTYHLNFFELLFDLVQTARKNAEDAGAWVQATGSKNRKRQNKQFQKQGAKVTLSNERAVATQVG